jgi:hypothetical protein
LGCTAASRAACAEPGLGVGGGLIHLLLSGEHGGCVGGVDGRRGGAEFAQKLCAVAATQLAWPNAAVQQVLQAGGAEEWEREACTTPELCGILYAHLLPAPT